MLKAIRLPNLAKGIVYFMTVAFGRASDQGSLNDVVTWASSSTKEILRTGLETTI